MELNHDNLYQAPEMTVVELEAEAFLAQSGSEGPTSTAESMSEEQGNW